MSAHSYPSPISTTPSPRMSDIPSPAVPPPLPIRRARRNTLQTAAADLDAAFARLEQVRSSLVRLSNRLPEPPTSRARDQLGPNHGAIMLTGEPGEPAWDSSTALNTEELLFAYDNSFRRAVQAQNSLAHLAEQSSALRQSLDDTPASPMEPPAPGRVQPQPLPLEPQGSRFYDSQSRDDGLTGRGRHVAAREQAGQRRTTQSTDPGNTPTTSATPLPSVQPRVRPENPRLDRIMEALSSVERQLQPSPEERLNQIHQQLTSPASPPLLWRQDPRRRRPVRSDTRPPSARDSASNSGTGSTGSSDRQSRLSMLSSFSSVQNFASPLSAAPSLARPLLFEEPESYIEPTPPPPEPRALTDAELDDGRRHSFWKELHCIERVQNINLASSGLGASTTDWARGDMDFVAEQARRRTIIQSFERGHRMNMPPTIPPGSMRRRGWSRLDSDGNEIPSEEEDELERYRTEYRIRATTRRGLGSTMNPNGSPASTEPLGPRHPMSLYGSVMDSVATVNNDSVRASRRRRTREVSTDDNNGDHRTTSWSPLPLPLESMVPSKGGRHAGEDEECLILMGPAASFAGR
ncbi:hypothetical protein DFP72DRAFT_866545 [Ephemerocybe angulata]|uniref:Uncharacterized protein n=1 Tax=Ephemerocybe angulata TaxID=980116 RepID=A0A8H6MHG7_9AGAR|nr:hypothetical protein DFP72DRAFT_866545 [Tulosesus angulatus]